MAWDESKETNQTRPNVPDKEKITSADWNAMVQDQKNHRTRHESGGVDELVVEGLSGELADPQPPREDIVNDVVDALLIAGDKLSTTYDANAGTLTIDTSALDTEEVEDAINQTLVGGAQVSTTYDDSTGTLTLTIDAPTQAEFDTHSTRHESGGTDTINHDALAGFVATEHVDHTTVDITAGAGLTGGGSIDTTRTLDAHQTIVATNDYTAAETDIVLVDAAGGPITVTLPEPSMAIDLHIKKIDASTNDVTITAPGTQTIDGDTSKLLNSEYLSLELTSDGSDYYILY